MRSFPIRYGDYGIVRVDDELTALVYGLECVEGLLRDLFSPPCELRMKGVEAAEQWQLPEDPG